MEPTKIQTFLDGCCDILGPDSDGRTVTRLGGVPFQLRTVGSKRFFEAVQIGHTIQRVIRIPDVGMALNDCFVTIRGQTYQILQAQEIMDSNPRCLQLSLEQPNICWAAERED